MGGESRLNWGTKCVTKVVGVGGGVGGEVREGGGVGGGGPNYHYRLNILASGKSECVNSFTCRKVSVSAYSQHSQN